MNEQLAAIRARREAVTPGGASRIKPDTLAYFRSTVVPAIRNYDGTMPQHLQAGANTIMALCEAFEELAAAPADIDTLLAEVERLDRVLTGQREYWFNEYRKAEAERDALATGREIQAALIDTLTTQRDALAAQLQQAQDDAAYLRSYVHALESYVPEASRRVAAGEARAQLQQQGA